MRELHISYQDLQEMPVEYQDWLYHRHVQYLVDMQKEQEQRNGGY